MNIKKVINEHGWTIERLAKEMIGRNGEKGISQPSLSQLINGGNPTYKKLQEIANIIGVSVSELVREESDSTSITCPHCGREIRIKAE